MPGSEEEAAGLLDAYFDAKRKADEDGARVATPASQLASASSVNPCVHHSPPRGERKPHD
jgi:hypothetical protein